MKPILFTYDTYECMNMCYFDHGTIRLIRDMAPWEKRLFKGLDCLNKFDLYSDIEVHNKYDAIYWLEKIANNTSDSDVYVNDLEKFKLVFSDYLRIKDDIGHAFRSNGIYFRDIKSLVKNQIKDLDQFEREVRNHLTLSKQRPPIALAGYTNRRFRTVCSNSYIWRTYFEQSRLHYLNYFCVLRSFKGGYVSPNYDFELGKIHRNIFKYDATSFYPAQMVKRKFPLGPIYEYTKDVNLERLYIDSGDYTIFADLKIDELELKPGVTIPMLKCDDLQYYDDEKSKFSDNNLIHGYNVCISANSITLKWLINQYKIKGTCEVIFAFRQKNLPLPKEVIKLINKFFEEKCKNGLRRVNGKFVNDFDELMYNVSKVLINSGFGLMAHDPLKYAKIKDLNSKPIVGKALADYYDNPKTWAIYQVGVMISAYALDEIFTLIEKVGYDDVIYVCVDSIAVVGKEAAEIVEDYNSVLLETAPYIEVNGKKEYYGVFKQELKNGRINILGPNCYGYDYVEDGKTIFHSFISGVPSEVVLKINGVETKITREEELGCLENLQPNFTFTLCTPTRTVPIRGGYREEKQKSITIKQSLDKTIG